MSNEKNFEDSEKEDTEKKPWLKGWQNFVGGITEGFESFKSSLEKQAEKKGLPLTWQLKWGMASYPRDVSTAAELVATAIQAVSGAEAKVIDLQQ